MTFRRLLLPIAPFLVFTACSDDESSGDPLPIPTSTSASRDAGQDAGADAGNGGGQSQSDASQTEAAVATTDAPTTSEVEPTTTDGEMSTEGAEPQACVDIFNCYIFCSTEQCLDICSEGQDYEDVLSAYELYICWAAFACEYDQCLFDNCPSEVVACVYPEGLPDSGVPGSEGPETGISDGGDPSGECPTPTGDGTEHQGFIESDEVWTAEGSPHLVTANVSVRGATLTIEPCAVVLVSEGSYISVGQTGVSPAASLVAKGEVIGEVVRPVRFSSSVDGEYWGGISALPTGTLELETTIVSHAGHANGVGVGQPSAILAYGDDNRSAVIKNVSLINVLIEQSASLGLAAMASGGFTDDSTDVIVAYAGLEGTQSGDIQTTYAGYVEAPAIHTWPVGDYTYNAKSEILIKAPFTLEVDETIPYRGVPYQMVSSFMMRPPTSEPTTLTLEPGVTIKFGGEDFPTATGMILGDQERPLALMAQGSLESPILLTSGAAAPAPGDWSGIWWDAAPSDGNVMSHVVLEYGGGESATNGFGCGPGDNDSLLFIAWEPSGAFILDSTFSNSSSGGIVSAWESDTALDLTANNEFTNIDNGCNVSVHKDADGVCPDNGGDPSCY